MGQGKIKVTIKLDIQPLVKAIRKFEGDAFAAFFKKDEELQLIKNLNNIQDSRDEE